MINRKLQTGLLEAIEKFPVVTVTGPRESGKSTLVRRTFPEKPYYSFENPDVLQDAETDPVGFLNRISSGAIIDEVQRLPLLLPYLKEAVEGRPSGGRFILTASHEPELHQSLEQSLSGITGIIPLMPLSLAELRQLRDVRDPFELIVKGMFPCVYKHYLNPAVFFENYIKTCVDRDVRTLINFKDIHPFYQFIRLVARQTGQVMNYTYFSKEVGVSATTIKNWIMVLKAAYIVFELPPFVEDIKKRLVKTPKLYFIDTGPAASLLGIQTPEQAADDPLREGLYENLIITEILKSYRNAGQNAEFFFYSDTHDNGVDLIVKHEGGLIPVEIDASETFTPLLLKNIEHFRKIAGKRCTNGFVLYNGSEKSTIDGNRVFNLI